MRPEIEHNIVETVRLGEVDVERTVDGRLVKIGDVAVEEGDSIIVVQRHQKPTSTSREDLLASRNPNAEQPGNLDYTYNPASTEEGAANEQRLLQAVKKALGPMDTIGVTPMRRGSEHTDLIVQEFPEATINLELNQKMGDSEIGLIGESLYGGYGYSLEQSKELFNPNLNKEARFGRGAYEGERKPVSYMEAWIDFSYLPENNRWKVESPEDLIETYEQVVNNSKGKNFFLTHEANCVVFHMLAQRDPAEVDALLQSLDLPHERAAVINQDIGQATTIAELFTTLRQSLSEQPIPGRHFKKILIQLLEEVRLKSGERSKGYGALSLYVVKKKDNQSVLLEAGYDQQV